MRPMFILRRKTEVYIASPYSGRSHNPNSPNPLTDTSTPTPTPVAVAEGKYRSTCRFVEPCAVEHSFIGNLELRSYGNL
jgi:hypothetical protein